MQSSFISRKGCSIAVVRIGLQYVCTLLIDHQALRMRENFWKVFSSMLLEMILQLKGMGNNAEILQATFGLPPCDMILLKLP